MMEEKLVNILNEMAEYLSVAQLKKLQEVLLTQLEPRKLLFERFCAENRLRHKAY